MNYRETNCKVVLLGDTAVGKSCLTARFVRNTFSAFEEPTIGAAFLAKNIDVNGNRIKLEIWDTAGQERYRSLAPMYYRGALAAIVVYDITQKYTLNGAKNWIKELKINAPNCIIVLVANKCDLKHQREITNQEVKEYATQNSIIHIETSAKSGHNIERLFNIIGEEIPIREKSEVGEGNVLQLKEATRPKREMKWC